MTLYLFKYLLFILIDTITLSVLCLVWYRQHKLIQENKNGIRGIQLAFNLYNTMVIILVFLNLFVDITHDILDTTYFIYILIRRVTFLLMAIIAYHYYKGSKFDTLTIVYQNTTGVLISLIKKIRSWH
jgi:hypothetical protein